MNLITPNGPNLTSSLDFGAAVEQFYPDLYRFGFSLAGTEADAADLTQETYHVLLTKGSQIRDANKVKSWLFTTLYRLFLHSRRQAIRFSAAPVDSVAAELSVTEATQAEHSDGALVVRALLQLEEKYRVPLTMFYLQEFSYREIAAALGLPVGTVMSRLSRGKAVLRQQLQAPEASTRGIHSTDVTARPAHDATHSTAV